MNLQKLLAYLSVLLLLLILHHVTAYAFWCQCIVHCQCLYLLLSKACPASIKLNTSLVLAGGAEFRLKHYTVPMR